MRTYWRSIRSFNADIRRYLLFNSFMAFAYMGTINVLMNLYLLRMGYDTKFIGALTGSGMLVWGVMALPAGALGVRWGLKRAVLRSMFVLALGALLLALAGWLAEPWRAPALVAAWMILWGGAALVSVNVLPYIMAVTTDENRSYVFSVQQTVGASVTLVGSLISGYMPQVLAGWLGMSLDQPLPYQLTLLLAPLGYLLACWAFSGATDISITSHESKDQKAQPAPLGIFLLLLLIVVMQSASDGSTRTFFNVYLDRQLNVSVGQIGAILGIAQLFPAVLSLMLPAIIHRLGTRGAMLTSSTLSIGFVLLLALIPNIGAASVAFMGMASLAMVMNTTRSIFCQEIVTPRWRTISSAIATIGIAGGWALSAWQGGSLVTTLGFRGLFLIGAGLALLASLFTLLDAQRSKQARIVLAVSEGSAER